jgi:AcrR family transcriptional regulator
VGPRTHKATTSEISERAGLSRGAHLHHFQTRATLLAAAALSLGERGAEDLRRGVERLPQGPGRLPAALDMVWELFGGPLFQAVLELSVHARTDPELRLQLDPLERAIGTEALPLLRVAFGREPDDGGLDDWVAMATATIRGLAILPVLGLRYDPARRWPYCRERLLAVFPD